MPKRRAKHAAAALYAPSAERLQHDRLRPVDAQIADAQGGIGRPWRAEDMLERLQHRGDIGQRERLAGEQFQRLFHRAHLDTLKASDLLRTPGGKAGETMSPNHAANLIWNAVTALGGATSPCGSIAWHCLGLDWSVKDWASYAGWSGRPVREEVAKGTLIGALGVLAVHFRL